MAMVIKVKMISYYFKLVRVWLKFLIMEDLGCSRCLRVSDSFIYFFVSMLFYNIKIVKIYLMIKKAIKIILIIIYKLWKKRGMN